MVSQYLYRAPQVSCCQFFVRSRLLYSRLKRLHGSVYQEHGTFKTCAVCLLMQTWQLLVVMKIACANSLLNKWFSSISNLHSYSSTKMAERKRCKTMIVMINVAHYDESDCCQSHLDRKQQFASSVLKEVEASAEMFPAAGSITPDQRDSSRAPSWKPTVSTYRK